jgi:hypothetical protein
MSTFHAVLDQPVQQAGDALQQAAGTQGWRMDPQESGINLLVFKKGATLVSWGAALKVSLQPGETPAQTLLTVTTSETFALTDWGRGKRAVERLLHAVGARRTI